MISLLQAMNDAGVKYLVFSSNKIQEYGKIKALGATKKQMKQLIFREGIFLTIFSIPVGLLLGFLIAKCGFNWLVEQGNLVSTGTDSMGVQNQQVSLFSLPVMLLCIFVSFLTVALALRKPMKIVSRISPIEATRYLGSAFTASRLGEPLAALRLSKSAEKKVIKANAR